MKSFESTFYIDFSYTFKSGKTFKPPNYNIANTLVKLSTLLSTGWEETMFRSTTNIKINSIFKIIRKDSLRSV